MLGERGLWYKMSFFDGSARVPLIASGSGVGAGREAGPVSHLDLAPTLAELLAVPVGEAGLEGLSLGPVLRGEGGGPGRALGEFLAEGVQSPQVMIRRGPFKYVRCEGDPELLYDLDADPDEVANLAADPAHAPALDALRAESDELWDLDSLRAQVLESQRRRRLVGPALARGSFFPWDFQPFTDASLQFVRAEGASLPRPWQLRPRGDLPAEPE
jgi:choline-sulfatase